MPSFSAQVRRLRSYLVIPGVLGYCTVEGLRVGAEEPPRQKRRKKGFPDSGHAEVLKAGTPPPKKKKKKCWG